MLPIGAGVAVGVGPAVLVAVGAAVSDGAGVALSVQATTNIITKAGVNPSESLSRFNFAFHPESRSCVLQARCNCTP